jgi:hypothetical protein
VNAKYLETVFPDYFNLIWSQLKDYTASINEMSYYFTFLFPIYMRPVYDAITDELKQGIVNKRGSELSCKLFRETLNELLDSLYMHVYTMADIESAL